MARAVLGLFPGVNSKGPGAMGLVLSVDSPPSWGSKGAWIGIPCFQGHWKKKTHHWITLLKIVVLSPYGKEPLNPLLCTKNFPFGCLEALFPHPFSKATTNQLQGSKHIIYCNSQPMWATNIPNPAILKLVLYGLAFGTFVSLGSWDTKHKRIICCNSLEIIAN